LKHPVATAEVAFDRISAGFGEMPFELDRIFRALDQCTLFMAIGTSGVVEPVASFVAHVSGRAGTICVGPEEPANASAFTEVHLGKAGGVLPDLLGQRCAS
jgi:NAD-dependent deacetylase